MTRILLVSGNTREDSLHTAALRAAARFAPAGIVASPYEGLRTLPAFVPGEPTPPDAVALLRHRVRTADALLISTPEYAGSLPGSCKNLLDWLIDHGDLDGKPVAWLSLAAPGQDDGARTMLETVLSHGGARLLRAACIRVPLGPDAMDAHGVITEARLYTALSDMLQSLARAVTAAPAPEQPSWQAYSSVYPIVFRPGPDSPAVRRGS